MIAKGGATLLNAKAIHTLKHELVPLVTLITPNVPEAKTLTGQKMEQKADFITAAQMLQNLGAKNVLIKRGHLDLPQANDYVLLSDHTGFWLTALKAPPKEPMALVILFRHVSLLN